MGMQLMKHAIVLTIQLPLVIVIAAATERFCRSTRAKWRNIGLKCGVAHVLTYYFSLANTMNYNTSSTECLCLFLRVVLLITGTVVGTALQPVGLTGGIATGKSTVSSLLCSHHEDETDFVIIDIDGIAHDILLPEKLGQDSVYHRLVKEFGTGILEDHGDTTHPLIDRRKLGDIVFRDREKRKTLNSITHPKIIKIMLKRMLLEGLNLNGGTKRRRVVCADIPLLFEGGVPMRMLFGTIIVVTCKPELQLERLHKRNSDLTLEQCRQRIASQIPMEVKARKAHKVIRNDGDIKELKSQVQQVKREVANIVVGNTRGIELSWLVMGLASLHLFKHFN